MTPLLRIRNPDCEKLKEEHYLFIEAPKSADLEEAILSPKAAGGVPLVGDVCLYPDRPIGKEGMPMMVVYSGIPDRAVIILERGYRDVAVKTGEDRDDIFVLCPDHTPDTYHRIPYSAFIPRSEALRIASGFLSDGTVETDDSWVDFEQFYHDLLSSPFTEIDAATTPRDNKASLSTPAPPRVQTAMIIQSSTHSRSLALGQV